MRLHLIGLAVIAACGGRSEPHVPTTTVVLAAPGQAPQRVLRYQPNGGDREVRIKLDVMTFVASVHLESADPVRYRFRGVRLETDTKVHDKVIEDAVTHVSGAIAGDTRGRAAASTDSSVYHTMPEFAPLFEEAIVAFPDEPVGIGARWRTSGRVWSADTEVTLDVDYELTALIATEATVHGHGTARDASGATTFDATTTVRFADLLPQRAHLVFHIPFPGVANPPPLVIDLE